MENPRDWATWGVIYSNDYQIASASFLGLDLQRSNFKTFLNVLKYILAATTDTAILSPHPCQLALTASKSWPPIASLCPYMPAPSPCVARPAAWPPAAGNNRIWSGSPMFPSDRSPSSTEIDRLENILRWLTSPDETSDGPTTDATNVSVNAQIGGGSGTCIMLSRWIRIRNAVWRLEIPRIKFFFPRKERVHCKNKERFVRNCVTIHIMHLEVQLLSPMVTPASNFYQCFISGY